MIRDEHNFAVTCPNETKDHSVLSFTALRIFHWVHPFSTSEVHEFLKIANAIPAMTIQRMGGRRRKQR
jgi:hypothetical protein